MRLHSWDSLRLASSMWCCPPEVSGRSFDADSVEATSMGASLGWEAGRGKIAKELGYGCADSSDGHDRAQRPKGQL